MEENETRQDITVVNDGQGLLFLGDPQGIKRWLDEEDSLLGIDEFLSGYDDLYDEWNRDAGTITAPDGREIKLHYSLHAIAATVPKTLGKS